MLLHFKSGIVPVQLGPAAKSPMSIIRPFDPLDILKFNAVNADAWTATYHTGYYASYAAQWPEFCLTVTDTHDSISAYMLAKHEPPPPDPQHHAHLTALSIAPPFRGLGLARTLMALLERLASPAPEGVNAWFVDLFVRCNNARAVEIYEKLGYSVYRRVVDYYHGMKGEGSTRDELDGFDMRKSMPRDSTGKYVRANGRDILVSPDQVWA